MCETSYDVDPMKSLTLENVLSVAKSENESESWVKPPIGSGKERQNFYSPCWR